MLTVWAVDAGRVRRGQLEPLDCSVVVRDCDVGTWALTVSDDELSRRIVAGWRVIIVDDGETIMSGPVLSFGVDVAERTVHLSGVDDLALIADRVIYPDPAVAASAQTTAYYRVTGAAETVVRDMIHLNAASGALVARRAGGLSVAASQGRGVSVTTNLRFKNLLEESRALARMGGISFTAVQDLGAQISVRFTEGRDLSRRVRFTANNGGLTGGSYQINSPTVTDVLVAGQGEGTARTIKEYSQASSWGRRIEGFKDQRNTDDPTELAQAGAEALAEGAEGASATVEASETPGLRFGTDFLLGDTVTAQFGTATISEPVRAVELAWDGHGRTAKLTLGDHESDEDQSPAWVKHVRNLSARVRGLETS